MSAARTVDPTGLVWQTSTRGGEKIIGEVHQTRAGRFYVVMVGKRIASSLKTFEEAKTAALDWEADDEAAPFLHAILEGRVS